MSLFRHFQNVIDLDIKMRWASLMLLAFAICSLGCAGSSALPNSHLIAERPTSDSVVKRKLVSTKAALMSADYRADLTQLRRLREQLAPLRNDAQMGYLADYWAGYASWRLAINGTSKNMTSADLKANIADAIADFEAAIKLQDDFADGLSAAASAHLWLGSITDEPAAAHDHFVRGAQLLARALKLEPDNPRVLWVEGGNYLATPVKFGGDPARAEKIYAREVEVAPSVVADSPLPDWGRAEGWMSLAYAHLHRPEPDFASAREDARAALKLQPAWWYVRDILMPQIDAAEVAAKTSNSRR